MHDTSESGTDTFCYSFKINEIYILQFWRVVCFLILVLQFSVPSHFIGNPYRVLKILKYIKIKFNTI